jgi:tetratricopeptide (TPR) repeat protein
MPDIAPRAIRVFVSSTFRDFTAERDRLARFGFPRLRRLCEERAVVFTEVDLRWGITDEQAAEGAMLPICLAEIDSSRPFFIGILGERYGWIPGSVSDEIVERHPWLAEHRTRSVTELEIMHGVLNAPAKAGRSFFYFRDRETSLAMGPDAAPESETARERLAGLKTRIRASGLPVREHFFTPEELEAAVVADLACAIDGLFPQDEVPDANARERMVHEAFGYELAAGFVLRPDLLAALDAHAAGDGNPLLVSGESGSGKSALLAHWSRAHATAHPDIPVIVHFCGASAASSDWASLCRRVAAALERATGVVAEIPDDPTQLKGAFKNLLFRAAAEKRFVLALDGVDQLEDREGAPELSFLPPATPAGCRLVVSTTAGTRPMTEAQRRQWRSLTVGELTPAQRPAVLLSLLSRRAKRLDAKRVERICAADAASKPLFLSVLADELCVVGSHDTLDNTLARYLAVEVADDLYERVLERYERDYDARPGLVRDAMRAIWAARRGISEHELLALLGRDGSLPQAMLAPLLLAAGRQLTSRGGLLTFAHARLGTAVADRFLESENSKRAAHGTLADYFERERMSVRSVDELPWQLQRASEWERLVALLADLEFLDAAWRLTGYEVLRYWATIERESPLRAVEAYRDAVSRGSGRPREAALAGLMHLSGHLPEASRLWEQQISVHRKVGDLARLQASLNDQALILRDRGDLDGALTRMKEQERICRELGDPAGLQRSLGHQALILRDRGDLDRALSLMKEQERICRELGDPASLQTCLGNQALILRDHGDLDGALMLMKALERTCREFGDPASLQMCLGNQAVILKARGDLDGAMALHKEQERICRELGNPASLQMCLGNQALILQARGDLDGAMALHKEQERICRALGNRAGLQISLGNQAVMLADRGNLDGAMALHQEQERIFGELGNRAGLQACLGNQALILQVRGDLDGAMALHKEEERICRELGDPAGLKACLGNQALILASRGDLDGAMTLHKEEERICRELGDPAGLQRSLGNQATILADRGDLDGAMVLHKEEERICRELGDPAGLEGSLGNQAIILADRGDLDGAMALHKEQEHICRELGDPAGLQNSLGNQATILMRRRDFDGALVLLKEKERICRELGNPAGLQNSLGNQATILFTRRDFDGAMLLLKEKERICRDLGDLAGLQRSLDTQAVILMNRRDFDGAILLLKEKERICRELGDPAGLQASLKDQALNLMNRGDLDGAMVLLKETEHICRELGNPDGLQRSLGNQALILMNRDDLDGAIVRLKEQESICRDLGNQDGLQASLSAQALIYKVRGDVAAP